MRRHFKEYKRRGFGAGHRPFGPHWSSRRSKSGRRIFSGSGIYRSRSGMLFGVCKGIANYFDISLAMVRILAILAFIFTGFWPVGVIYIVLALLMKPEPVVEPSNVDEAEFYSSYAASRTMAVSRLKSTFDRLERRLRRLEDTVTSRDFSWDQKAKS